MQRNTMMIAILAWAAATGQVVAGSDWQGQGAAVAAQLAAAQEYRWQRQARYGAVQRIPDPQSGVRAQHQQGWQVRDQARSQARDRAALFAGNGSRRSTLSGKGRR